MIRPVRTTSLWKALFSAVALIVVIYIEDPVCLNEAYLRRRDPKSERSCRIQEDVDYPDF